MSQNLLFLKQIPYFIPRIIFSDCFPVFTPPPPNAIMGVKITSSCFGVMQSTCSDLISDYSGLWKFPSGYNIQDVEIFPTIQRNYICMIYQTHMKCCFYLKCKHKYFQIEIKTNMSMNLMLSNFVGYIYKGYIRQFVSKLFRSLQEN